MLGLQNLDRISVFHGRIVHSLIYKLTKKLTRSILKFGLFGKEDFFLGSAVPHSHLYKYLVEWIFHGNMQRCLCD